MKPDKYLRSYIQFFALNYATVCHAYRVNRLKELVETRHVDRIIITGVPFLWFQEKDHGDMTQNPTGVKIMQSNLCIKILPVMSELFD